MLLNLFLNLPQGVKKFIGLALNCTFSVLFMLRHGHNLTMAGVRTSLATCFAELETKQLVDHNWSMFKPCHKSSVVIYYIYPWILQLNL